MSKKPLCFVIMGFGKKTDYATGKTLDLDKTYLNIIKPAVIETGYECIRADEVEDSGLIDKSMYALLLKADLVVADISTYNPNALYELGIRHAARPFSTIIIREEEGIIPFDLSHTRIFHYAHLGDDIGVDEAKRCVGHLVSLIKEVKETCKIDSPLYEFIEGLIPLNMNDDDFNKVITDLARRENSIFALSENARIDMANNEFNLASAKWKKAAELADNEPYFIQQYALARYKSKSPSENTALIDALEIIKRLEPDSTNDPETLGITGAIYKRLWFSTQDLASLKRATDYYKKGFTLTSDYYTGENYANCLDLLGDVETNNEEVIYYRVEAKRTRKEIIESLNMLETHELSQRYDEKWIYATLSNTNFSLDENEKAVEFEAKFLALNPLDWEVNTFNETKNKIKERKH